VSADSLDSRKVWEAQSWRRTDAKASAKLKCSFRDQVGRCVTDDHVIDSRSDMHFGMRVHPKRDLCLRRNHCVHRVCSPVVFD
jgi:hypothetical protein